MPVTTHHLPPPTTPVPTSRFALSHHALVQHRTASHHCSRPRRTRPRYLDVGTPAACIHCCTPSAIGKAIAASDVSNKGICRRGSTEGEVAFSLRGCLSYGIAAVADCKHTLLTYHAFHLFTTKGHAAVVFPGNKHCQQPGSVFVIFSCPWSSRLATSLLAYAVCGARDTTSLGRILYVRCRSTTLTPDCVCRSSSFVDEARWATCEPKRHFHNAQMLTFDLLQVPTDNSIIHNAAR